MPSAWRWTTTTATVGATSGTILRIFILEGSAIGLVGTVLGTVAGLVGCWFLDRYKYPLETDVYYLDTLPVVVDPKAVATIAVGALVICFLCTIYPAWRGGYYYAVRKKGAEVKGPADLGLVFVTKWAEPAAQSTFATCLKYADGS